MSKRKTDNQEGYGNNRNKLQKLIPKEREEFEYEKEIYQPVFIVKDFKKLK